MLESAECLKSVFLSRARKAKTFVCVLQVSIRVSQHRILLTPMQALVRTCQSTALQTGQATGRRALASVWAETSCSWPEFLLGEDGMMCCACSRLIGIC